MNNPLLATFTDTFSDIFPDSLYLEYPDLKAFTLEEYSDSQPFTHIHNLVALSGTVNTQLLDQHTTRAKCLRKRGQKQHGRIQGAKPKK